MEMSRKRIPRLAMVTGADGGIGSAFCEELAAMGSDLVLVGINAEGILKTASALKERYGIETYNLQADLTTETGISAAENFTAPGGMRPDMLVNNAGIFAFRPLIDMSDAKTQAFIDLHITAVTRLSRHYGRLMTEKGYGWILNMSSMSCWMPMPGLGMYASTKAYIRVFTRSLSYELKDSGVNVCVACPGGIATPLFGLPENLMKLALNLKALSTPRKIARQALSKVFKGKHQLINGMTNRLAILAVGMTPGKVRMMVKHRMLDKGITR